ncbi:MAG: hypothetical protein GXY03_08985, partial [Solirubrobacterales bacterium]|nr:hypothetical protein [Solirubrobacterales bacterium]
NVLSLYWARLRPRLAQELLAVVGIAVGVALVFAALVANASLTSSVRDAVATVTGDADLQVASQGPRGFDAAAVERIAAVPGVAVAAPVAETRVNLATGERSEPVVLVGADSSFAQLGGELVHHLAAGRATIGALLALPEPVADALEVSVGERVTVESGLRRSRVPFGTVLRESDVGPLVDSPVALAPLAQVQRIAGLDGRVTRVLVRSEPGRTEAVAAGLRAVAPPATAVLAADADVASFERASYPTSQSTALFSIFSALVGFLFAFSAMLLTVPQRQRLIADLQLAGHPPWVIVEVLAFDALVLGVAGTGLGLALGDAVSGALFGSAPDYLLAAFAIGERQTVSWQSAAIAGAAGMGAALVAVLAPLRGALARHPLMPRAEHPGHGRATDRALAGCGALAAAAAAALVVVAPGLAVLAMFVLTLALLLVLPLLLRAATCLFEIATRGLRTPVPTLVAFELRSPRTRSRTLALAATGAVAVFATVAIGGGNADLQRGLQQSAREIDRNADLWVSFDADSNALGTTPFAAGTDLRERIAALPAVATVADYRGGFLDVGDRRAWVVAPPAGAPSVVPPSQVRSGDPARAARRLAEGGWVAVSDALADQLGVGVGDRVALPTPVPVRPRVAAITTNLAWPPGAIVLNAADAARAWGSPEVTALHLDLVAGSDPDAAAEAVATVVGDRPLRVETARERTLRHFATAENALARLDQIALLVLLSAILATAVAMAGMIW